MRSQKSSVLPKSVASQESFTLIELLIVIGILAVLVAAVVVVLNPAQLLAQARDSKRQQDLSALNQALNTVYALDQTVSFGTSSIVYTSLPDSSSTCGSWGLPSLPTGWTYHCVPTSTLQNTNGTGWIPVNFQSNGVVNLSSLPTDPVNSSSTGLYYTYVTGGSFELTAIAESQKYKIGPWNPNQQEGAIGFGSNMSVSPFFSTQGLVGWWKFDDATGTSVSDSSGNGNTGTIYGPVTWVTGKVGGALSFNGTTNYVSMGNKSGLNMTSSLTMAAWAFLSDTTVIGTFIAKGNYNAGRPGYTLYPMAPAMPKIGAEMDLQGVTPTSLLTPSAWQIIVPGQWYFVVSTYDGSQASLYINGKLAIQQAATGGITTNSDNFIIGNDSGLSFPHKGLLDDVRLYNRALSPAEIQALYNATK